MNTLPIVPSAQGAVLAETHIEIFGHAFRGYPTISELADVLGHTYRTVRYAASLTWIWDELGIAACSWPYDADNIARRKTPDPQQDNIRCVYFALQSLGKDEGPLKPFPKELTVFGHRWAPEDDPHSYVKRLLAATEYLGFKPNYDLPTTWQGINHTTKRLSGGGLVTVFDPAADSSVDRTAPNEVAVRFNFPSTRPPTEEPQSAPEPQRQATPCSRFFPTNHSSARRT